MSKKNKFYKDRKNLPMEGFTFEYTDFHHQEIEKCKNDIIYFAETYFFIIDGDLGRTNLKLFQKQRDILNEFQNKRFNILLSSRQTGKSTLMTIKCLHYAIFFPDKKICYGANKEVTAMEMLDRIKLAYEELPNWLKPGLKENNAKSLTFANGSEIITSSTTENTFRGFSIHLLCLDEFAFVDKSIADKFFTAVMPAVSAFKSSKVIIVSTPNGADGIFYDLYTQALTEKNKTKSIQNDDDDSNWNGLTMHWSDFPGRDEKWEKTMKATLGNDEQKWNQEFQNVFMENAGSAFNAVLLKHWLDVTQNTFPIYKKYGDKFKFYKNFDIRKIYVFGVDTSQGLLGDNHSIQIIDITDPTNIEQVATYAANDIPINVFVNMLYETLTDWGSPLVCIERFGPGEACAELLKNLYKYKNIVNYRRPDKISMPDYFSCVGIDTKPTTKTEAINNFKYYFEYLKCFKFNDRETVVELQTFKRFENGSYRANSKYKDDRILALLWALYVLERDLAEFYLNVAAYDEAGKVLSLINDKKDLDYKNEIIVDRATIQLYTEAPYIANEKILESMGFVFV